MPLSPFLAPYRGHSVPRLLLITALVLLVHACLLQQGPRLHLPWDAPSTAPASRLLSAELAKPRPASATPVSATPPLPMRPATPVRATKAERTATASAAASTPAMTTSAMRTAAVPATAHTADTRPQEPPANASRPEASSPPPSGSGSASTPLLAATDAPPPRPLRLPPPARVLYDGQGNDRGFSYSAGGELLWLPDGTQYTAKLEITFLLARLRTWTSKGTLGESGLQPLRFGDKPRGAELATHFQRDKGIISFSANNPDVPLQSGAQDKLTSLLQLGALVAGEPTRYGVGSSIRFQAADAHRAELWDFRVSATETLELPGGTLQAIKLSKEPTVEFDQRIEVWLAPAQNYLPVRLRITEGNGAVVDLLWRKTLKPDASP